MEENDFFDASRYSLLDFAVHEASFSPMVSPDSLSHFSISGARSSENFPAMSFHSFELSSVLSANFSPRARSASVSLPVSLTYAFTSSYSGTDTFIPSIPS